MAAPCARIFRPRRNRKTVHWILALVGIAIVPLFSVPTRSAGKTRWTITKESQACSDEINGILNETMSVSGQLLVKLSTLRESDTAAR